MPKQGFYFKRLEARGKGKNTAVLEMKPGLNVISGASDTGKSYLVDCLNFMTGGGTPPKPIAESRGYESLWLEICDWENTSYTLERSLKGKDFRLYRSAIDSIDENTDSEILKAKKTPGNTQSASEFLLELCRMENVKLRKNTQGIVRDVSFRDVAHVTIINEERIYTAGSPVHASGQFIHKTVEQSFFRYLITGVDDGSTIVAPATKQSNAQKNAQKEIVQSMLEEIESTLLNLTDTPNDIENQLAILQNSLDELMTARTVDREQLQASQNRRKELWHEIEMNSRRVQVLSRLVNRFKLLESHYSSDQRRLNSMAEAGAFIGQLPQVACPICGTENPWTEPSDSNNLDLLHAACIREANRIESLQSDLTGTMNDIRNEMTEIEAHSEELQNALNQTVRQIEEELLPAESVARQDLNVLLEARSRFEKARALEDQLESLRNQLESLESKEENETDSESEGDDSASATTSETDRFCKVIEKLLTEWKFPDKGRVVFSEAKQDIVINSKDRGTHGKGIRALSYAAFVVSLQRFCRSNDRPHPGFVVLDSPLVAYREPDSKQTVDSAGVKEAFYRSLAKDKKETQCIIFENEDPPEDMKKKIQYLHFSGSETIGERYGFFPK